MFLNLLMPPKDKSISKIYRLFLQDYLCSDPYRDACNICNKSKVPNFISSKLWLIVQILLMISRKQQMMSEKTYYLSHPVERLK